MLIVYFDKLLKDRDLLFELQCSLSLRHVDEVYAYIMNAFFREVQMRNDINLFIIIFRKARLSQLREYEQNECFFIDAHHADLIVIN